MMSVGAEQAPQGGAVKFTASCGCGSKFTAYTGDSICDAVEQALEHHELTGHGIVFTGEVKKENA